MTLDRRAGAPRLIDWTGERCVPWAPDFQVVYEHMHRYLWAARLVRGKRVLDLGSGEGFGAAMLADAAREVVGVDIDERTIEHARLNWSSPTVSFVLASALDLSAFDPDSFDAVVAFEIIEHLTEQERMLAEIERVLSSDGLLIISTPDRRIHSKATGQENPLHERELMHEGFRSLLATTFTNAAVWGQRMITGSHLGALDREPDGVSSAQSEFFIERAGEEWHIAGEPAALNLVAVASNAALPDVPETSTLGDCGLELLRAKEREAGEPANALKLLDTELIERDEQIGYQQKELLRTRSRMREMEAGLVELHAQLEDAQRFTRRVEASVTWQTFQKIRGRVLHVIGEGSIAARALRA